MGCLPSKPLPRVIVLGASGFVGKATLQALQSSSHADQVEIFAGTRDPEKWRQKQQEQEQTVSVTEADMSDKAALAQTLSTFSRVFIVVPGHEDRTQHALNALEAAKDAGCEFVLLLSVLTCADATADTVFGKQFQPLEAKIKELDLPSYAIVRLPLFIDNTAMSAASVKEEGNFYDPRDPSKPYTPISVQDIGKAAAAILANPEPHNGKTYKLVCPAFSLNEQAAVMTSVLEKDVKPSTVHYNAAKESFLANGFPEWQVNGILELYRLIDDGSPITNEADTGDFEKITGEQPQTFQVWMEQNKATFL